MTDTASMFFLGYPKEFKNICLVYPPKVKDVISYKNFHVCVRSLTLSQEEIEDEYVKANLEMDKLPTPFEYLLMNALYNLSFRKIVEDAFSIITHEKILFLFDKKMIAIGDLREVKNVEKLRMMKEEDYFDFQNLVREALGGKAIEPPNPNEDPRIKKMKAKMRYRDAVKAKQSAKKLDFKSTLASISCMGMGLNPLNIGELSYASIPTLIGIYQQKEKYEIDVDSLLAGAGKKVHPVYWIKNLDE